MENEIIPKESSEIREAFFAVIQDQGRKQTWIAERLDLSKGYVNNVLSGKVDPFPAIFRKRLNELLGTDI